MSYSITSKCTGCTACVRLCPAAAIRGERRQVHQLDAARCIECGACGRICPAGAVLDAAGAQCLSVKRSAWKKPVVNKARCLACVICLQACPVSCLGLEAPLDGDPHAYPMLAAPAQCLACGFCEAACPVGAITLPEKVAAP